MFDFRKLEAFCKVCELRSFSKAGESLFLSQPTVSAHIQTLERELGVRLLDRMGRTVLPTPAGHLLHSHAKKVFDRLEAAKAEISALASEVTGELLIGSSAIPANHMLPQVITHFLSVHPKVRPNITVASSQVILERVQEGELMAGIVGINFHGDSGLSFTPLMEDEIIVLAPHSLLEEAGENIRLAGGRLPELSFEQAHFLPWIVREPTSTTRCAFEDALRLAGYDPRLLAVRLTVGSSNTVVQYIEAGLGVGVVTRLGAREALRRGTVRAFQLAGVRAIRRFSCVTNSRRIPFPAAMVFLECLRAASDLCQGGTGVENTLARAVGAP